MIAILVRADGMQGDLSHLSGITSVITEPGRLIIQFQKTRKTGFACITLLSADFDRVSMLHAIKVMEAPLHEVQFRAVNSPILVDSTLSPPKSN